MDKMKEWEESRDLGQELLESVKDMKAGKAGRSQRVELPMATRARLKTGLSQSKFAERIGVSIRTLQEWEQGRRKPSGAAKTLLKLTESDPSVLKRVA